MSAHQDQKTSSSLAFAPVANIESHVKDILTTEKESPISAESLEKLMELMIESEEDEDYCLYAINYVHSKKYTDLSQMTAHEAGWLKMKFERLISQIEQDDY